MVSCLHQSNAYIKRKLQVCRVQKCIPLVGAKSALTCAGRQTTPSHVSQYRAENWNLRKSGLPFAIVPCLHQSNIYIKRKLQVWRVQKCIPLVGAKTALTCAWRQTTPSHVSQYRSENGTMRKSFVPFAMVPSLNQSNVYIKRKLQVWRVQNCIPLIGAKTALLCAEWQSTQFYPSQYRAENGNLRKCGSTFCHGTVFAPKQRLYQKEATGMESPKMHSLTRCKNCTYLCGTGNCPSHVSQ